MGNLTQATSIIDMERIVQGIAVTASGTAIDFTNIPSWVKRITVMFNGVSTNGSSVPQIQLGDSGGIENSGYTAAAVAYPLTPTGTLFTTGFGLIDTPTASSTATYSGVLPFLRLSDNSWVCSGTLHRGGAGACTIAGSKTLSTTLDRIRITTVNGTDTFDAGQINIIYEG